ncbi:MAG: single-stranded DNA-binding protein [Patescibacteria group bacterium]
MSARSLNKVTLIGNLTRDPELRYTPQGTAVCTMGLATNRGWVTDQGEKKEETEFHRIVAWNKLAELCNQLCAKGRRIYVEGRLQTRQWTGQDGQLRTATEIVIEDMILLDSAANRPQVVQAEPIKPVNDQPTAEQVAEDIPF